METDMTRADELLEAENARLQQQLAAAEAAFKELLAFNPDATVPFFGVLSAGEEITMSDAYEREDEDAPFFTETFQYGLWQDKDTARSLLSLMRRVGEALGVPVTELP